MDEEYWSAVRTVRLDVADLLESLSAAEWDAPSLCRGWRVRDVAGHLSIIPTITSWELLSAAPRVGFNLHRVNTRVAIRHGSRPPEEILGRLRAHAGDRRTARLLDTRDSLFDVIVHSQDISLPLGRSFPVPAEYTRRGLDRVWAMGWPFKAARRLAGVTVRATDTDWTAGSGPEVAGPALSLLLLLTGRTSTALPTLEGPGVAAVRPTPSAA
jgi:uncharacterized protein (TIGR03083 family)